MSPKNAQLSCWKQLKSWKSLVDLLLNNCNTLILRLKLRNNFFKNIAFTFASDAAMLIGWKHLAMLDVITHCQQCFFKTIAGCDRQSMRTHCIHPCLYGLTVREPAINWQPPFEALKKVEYTAAVLNNPSPWTGWRTHLSLKKDAGDLRSFLRLAPTVDTQDRELHLE